MDKSVLLPPEQEIHLLEQLHEAFVVPVLRLTSVEAVCQTARQWIERGATVLEVPWTVPEAGQAVRALRQQFGSDILLGAGTALTPVHLEEAAEAGCRFAASPVHRPGWMSHCRELGLLPIPGALTPNEVFAALESGAPLIKLFPVSVLGGASYLQSLRGPFPDVKWMPCGGIRPDEIEHYRSVGAWAIGLGRQAVAVPLDS